MVQWPPRSIVNVVHGCSLFHFRWEHTGLQSRYTILMWERDSWEMDASELWIKGEWSWMCITELSIHQKKLVLGWICFNCLHITWNGVGKVRKQQNKQNVKVLQATLSLKERACVPTHDHKTFKRSKALHRLHSPFPNTGKTYLPPFKQVLPLCSAVNRWQHNAACLPHLMASTEWRVGGQFLRVAVLLCSSLQWSDEGGALALRSSYSKNLVGL